MPEISIVVTTYNAARYLDATLEGIHRQTFQDWELVILDDGSSDETIEIAARWAARDARIRLVQQENGGIIAARNAGLRATNSSSKAVMFHDHDDVLETDALDVLYPLLNSSPTYVAAHALCRYIDEEGVQDATGMAEHWSQQRRALVQGKIQNWPVGKPTTLSALLLINPIITPGSVLIRRDALDSVGAFDPDPRTCPADDFYLYMRLACRGDLAFVNKVVLNYRAHGGNFSRDRRGMDRARWHVQHKFVMLPWITEDQRHLGHQALYMARLFDMWQWSGWAWESLRQGRVLQAANQTRHVLVNLLHFVSERVTAGSLTSSRRIRGAIRRVED